VHYFRVQIGKWPAHRSVLVTPFAFGEIDERVSVVYLNTSLKSPAGMLRFEDGRVQPRLPLAEAHGQTTGIEDDADRVTGSGFVAIRQSVGIEVAKIRDPQLCSWREILGYTVQTLDTRIGHVSDLIAEDHNWTILFLVVDVGGWWGGKKLLVLPEWIEGVSSRDSLVHVNVGAHVVCDAPRFRSAFLFNHEYQEELLSIYYGKEADK
jgi:PRC-barrel domain